MGEVEYLKIEGLTDRRSHRPGERGQGFEAVPQAAYRGFT